MTIPLQEGHEADDVGKLNPLWPPIARKKAGSMSHSLVAIALLRVNETFKEESDEDYLDSNLYVDYREQFNSCCNSMSRFSAVCLRMDLL